MPVYPCRECQKPVDPTSDPKCECGSDKPFECSKCGDPIGRSSIYRLEKLKTKKPLFCHSCGNANEVVKCGICKIGLVRSQGHQVSQATNAKVYHKACYDKQMETIRYATKAAPFLAVCGVLIGLMAYGFSGRGLLVSGGVGVGAFAAVQALIHIIQPK